VHACGLCLCVFGLLRRITLSLRCVCLKVLCLLRRESPAATWSARHVEAEPASLDRAAVRAFSLPPPDLDEPAQRPIAGRPARRFDLQRRRDPCVVARRQPDRRQCYRLLAVWQLRCRETSERGQRPRVARQRRLAVGDDRPGGPLPPGATVQEDAGAPKSVESLGPADASACELPGGSLTRPRGWLLPSKPRPRPTAPAPNPLHRRSPASSTCSPPTRLGPVGP
jgi:hypothetical protein